MTVMASPDIRDPAVRQAVAQLERQVRQLSVELAELRNGARPSAAEPFDRVAWLAQHGLTPADVEVVEPRPYGEVAMSVTEAARELGLSTEQVRRHLRSERIVGIPRRGRGGWVVSRASIEEFRDSRARTSRSQP